MISRKDRKEVHDLRPKRTVSKELLGTASLLFSTGGLVILCGGLCTGGHFFIDLSGVLFLPIQLTAFILGALGFSTLRGKLGVFVSLFQGLIFALFALWLLNMPRWH